MRMMYVHSFQSLIWNRMATLRLERFGWRAVPGDLVLAVDEPPGPEDAAAADEGLSDDNEHHDDDDDDAAASSAGTGGPRPLAAVRTLSAADAAHFSIFDVVLPLPGFLVTYPGNGLEQEYVQAMADVGVAPEHLRHRVK